jgi:hypothetical protein
MAPLRQWLRQRRLVQTALATPIDPTIFRRPPPRVVAGLVLLGLSYALGWPTVLALGGLAAWLHLPRLLVVGPVVYGVSWIFFVLGLALIGSKSMAAGRAFGLWLVRRLAERFLRD